MSNEIMIKIRSDADKSGFKDAKDGLHDVETAADKAGNAIAKMERDARGRFKKKIPVEFEVPDGLGIGPSKEKVKVPVEPDRSSVKSFMTKFGDLAMGAVGPVSKLLGNHVGITVGAAAGAAAAPVLASAIGSALSAGAGAGVIGAGVALAVKGDKSLQAAGKLAGKDFMKAMGDEAKVFVGPVRESLGVLEAAGGRIARKWGDAFDEMSDHTVPFVKDVVSGVERISDALTNVASESGPAIAGLGDTWKLLADGVGDFIEIVADGGPEAASSLRLISGATADLLRYTGMTLNLLNQYGAGPLTNALKKHYKETAEAAGTFQKRTQGVAVEMEHAAAAARGQREALEGLSDELKAQADPVFAIIKAQDDLAAAQKETADATKKHGKNSAQAEAALQKQALAALSLEANIGKLGSTFDGKMTPAMRATLRAAGLTAPAIARLERQFRQARSAGDRFAKTYAALVKANGVPKTVADLNRIRGIVNSMDGRTIDIAMRITNVGSVSKAAAAIRKQYAHGGIRGAADGATSSGLTLVGEQGPELAEIAPGGRVWSNPDTQRMLAGAGGGQQGPITVNLVVDGKVLAQATVEPLRGMVNRQGSGNAQKFWGQG
jgi:hypothetical protein